MPPSSTWSGDASAAHGVPVTNLHWSTRGIRLHTEEVTGPAATAGDAAAPGLDTELMRKFGRGDVPAQVRA